MKTDNKLVGTGLLTAIAASLCCITPVLALIAGTSGLASNFSWLEPFRPYFIGLTILVIGFAWYQKLKPQKKIDCKCETTEKINFMQTKSFLGIITQSSKIQKVEFTIKGMTCSGCEHHIKTEISKLKGIIEVVVSYEKSNAIVKFDNKQTRIAEIEKAINSTGYKSLKSKIIS